MVWFSFLLTSHMRGESGKINLAGRQRMQTLSIIMGMHLLTGENPLEPDERGILTSTVRDSMHSYEQTLYGLRDGDKSLNLQAIHRHDRESRAQLDNLMNLWENSQKPVLTDILALPPYQQRQSCQECHELCVDQLAETDGLVSLMERYHSDKLEKFKIYRFIILAGFFVAVAGMTLYTYNRLIRPVKRLQKAALGIGQGNLDLTVPVDREDEIGYLGQAFNTMTTDLRSLFQKLEINLNHLSVLNRISTVSGKSLVTDRLLQNVLHEILSIESLALQKKGAVFLFDESTEELHLTVSEGFSAEHLSLCSSVALDECLCGLAAAEVSAVYSKSNSSDHRHSRTFHGEREHGHYIQPLIARDKLLGVLCLYLNAGEQFTEHEEKLLRSCADIIVMALQNAINYQQITMLAESLESSGDFIVITDPEGKIIHVNQRVENYSGYEKDGVLGQDTSMLQSPSNPEGLGREILEQTKAGGWTGEVINIRKDGSEYPVLLTTSTVHDEEGNITAMVGISRDITDRKETEAKLQEYSKSLESQVAARTDELQQAKQQAEAANRAKSDFLANMSHELRTPLNAIIGFSEIIADEIAGPTTDDQREYLGDIIDSSRHLLSLINDILDLSKVEAGQEKLKLTTVSVPGLVNHSMVLFKEKAMKHGIALETDLAENIGDIIADERKIKQVLVNLLANAMKFTPDGGRVSITVVPEGDDGVRFTVQDSGVGISEEDIPLLFQPFQQLDSELSRKYPGTGLGLSLCRRFVEMHGGRIWVESELKAGSRFIFVLPEKPVETLAQDKSTDVELKNDKGDTA